MNLLGNDLTAPTITKHIIEINKFFRNHHHPSAWLKKQHNSIIPTIPNDTRWKGQLMTLETFIRNGCHYLMYVHEFTTEINKNMAIKISDTNLMIQVTYLKYYY